MRTATSNKKIGFATIFALSWIIVLVFNGCKKADPVNPYDSVDRTVHNQNPTPDNLPEGSFAWLHAKIFKPTCANSGCHDGTFEPEFRTIASSYNSLVNHPVISNNEGETFVYRVVPGNSSASLLHERLTVDIPNTSGMMPLSVDPGSDWDSNSSMYIQRIAAWIDDGAKDMFGNPAPAATVNASPLVYGMAIFPQDNTTTPYPRQENSIYGIGGIVVPQGLVDVWIFPYDDNAGINGFTSASIKMSANVSDFQNAPSTSFILSTPITALDFGDSPNQFYYKATLDLSAVPSGETRYLRSYLDDGVQTNLTEVPNDASNYFWYLIFSLIVE